MTITLDGGPGVGGDAEGDVLEGIEGIVGSAFADTLTGSSWDDDLQGGDGDDVLTGSNGNDTLDGGAGSDRAEFSAARSNYRVTLDAATGTYIVQDLRENGFDRTDRVRNVETFVFADGEVSVEAILAGNPAPIVGDDGDNALVGTSLGNEMRGLGGNDTLSGIAGDDTFDGGAGDDTLDGGTGSDTASYASAASAVSVSLAAGGPQATGGAGTDTLLSIEHLVGSVFDDALTGDGGANVLSGLAGNDRLEGGAVNDTLRGGVGDDILIGGAGADVLDGGDGFDFVSYETSTSTSVSPLLNVMVIDLADLEFGRCGRRQLCRHRGRHRLRQQRFHHRPERCRRDADRRHRQRHPLWPGRRGPPGRRRGQRYVHRLARQRPLRGRRRSRHRELQPRRCRPGTGVTVYLGDTTRNTGLAAGDSYASIESVMGSVLDDLLVGDAGDNVILGSYGNDRLIGGDGANVLNGNFFFNEDPTVLYDGTIFWLNDGLDIASYETATSGVVASLRDATLNTGDAAGDTYILIEGLVGSAFDDTLEGDENANTLVGGAGNDRLIAGTDWTFADRLDGGEGDDTVVLAGSRADYTITFDMAAQALVVSSRSPSAGSAHLTGVERLEFADGTLLATSIAAGDSGDNSLIGSDNADDLSGGDGNDTLEGRGGDDRIDGGLGLDVASYASAAGAVHIDLGIAGSQATGSAGTDTLLSIEGVAGSALDDTLIGNAGNNVLSGGGGNDLLIGLGGTDALDGGAGNDTVSYATATFGATVDLAAGAPQGTFSDRNQSGLHTLVNIENIVGSATWSNTLKGDGGANRLTGGSSTDTLMGRGGDDILDGAGGVDTVSYAEASAGVTVDLAVAGPQSTGEGADTLISIENVTGSALADTLRGTDGDNVVLGGAGDDTLAGRGGFDHLDGGEGSDTASFADATTGVSIDLERNLSSMDRLFNIESLVGSAFADTLIGNAEANALSGGAGSDHIAGGLGRDTLAGGSGRDIFVLNALGDTLVGPAGRDRIVDFQSGLDDIDLSSVDANVGRSGNQDFRFMGTRDFSGRAGELRYQLVDQAGTASDITVVSGDVDGDGTADFEIEIAGLLQLTQQDFLL